MAASTVGGTDGSSLARKGVCEERLYQVTSVTTQVAISRGVHRYELALRDRQAAMRRREETGVLLMKTWGLTLPRSRVDEGLLRGEGASRSP